MFNDKIFGNQIIDPASYVSSKATLIGAIIIEKDVIIAPGACLRADEGTPFKICKGTNIQDGVKMHGLLDRFVEVEGKQYSIYIGSHCSIAHAALIHGPSKIGKKTFVGFRTTIHNSVVGRNCYIGFHVVINGVNVADNRYVPDGMIVNCQEIADSLQAITAEAKHFNKEVVDYNKKLITLYQDRRKMKNEG